MTKRFLLASSAFSLTLLLALGTTASAQDGGAYGSPATNMELRLSAVEDQLRALTGKVEQVDYLSRRLDQALQRLQADYDARLLKLETSQVQTQAQVQAQAQAQQAAPQRVAAPSAQLHEAEEDVEATQQQTVTGSLGGMKLHGDKVTAATVAPKTPPLPNKPDDYGLTPQEQYERAFGLLRQANYDDAEKAFKSFIDKNANDKLLDNAKYWYAETYYVRGKFNDAAIAFADAFQQNPKGTKAPDSLLKLAMSLGSVDKAQDACGALAALKAKYPSASATIRARADQERSRLKCK